MVNYLKIVFFGSDDFAVVHLQAMIKAGLDVVAVVCAPDKAQGRGMKVTLSPVKKLAQEVGIVYFQPDNLRELSLIAQLQALGADCFVVVSFGHLLSQAILDIPKIILNVHGSLLPMYRGAAPIQWAIINGDQQTGVSVQRMVLALDAGDVMVQEIMPISDITTTALLRIQMSQVGSRLLLTVLDDLKNDRAVFKKQDERLVTLAPKLSKQMGNIVWLKQAREIHCLVRGLYPWPGAFTFYKDKMIKVIESCCVDGHGKPGEIINISKEGITVACGQGALLLLQLQPESSHAMCAYDFAQGARLAKGDQFICQKLEKIQ